MRMLVVTLVAIGLLLPPILHAQCPAKDSIQQKINFIYNSVKLSNQDKLVKLQECGRLLKQCYSTSDSTYALFLRKTGYVYSDTADYLSAVAYLQQAINTITTANWKSARLKDLIGMYYYLTEFYDSLNDIAEKIKAADKCIDICFRLNNPSNISCIRSLYTKVEYYFDIGDYFQCIRSAEMCEKYVAEYLRSKISPSELEKATRLAKSAVGWHVNALLNTENFVDAARLLSDKVDEYKKEYLREYLAFIYAQFAELHQRKGEYTNALSYYNLAFNTYRDIGDDFNCKQTLNNIGQTIFFPQNNSDKALEYYRRALLYRNRGKFSDQANFLETLSVFGNIANVYVRKALYDSAFKYFQAAFDQLKEGISETGILESSPKEFVRYKKIRYLSSLVIDKADAFLAKYKTTNDPAAAREALRIYKEADRLLNRIRTGQSDLESKLFWRKDSRRLYEHAVEACYLQKDIVGAFYFFERSRAVLLNEQLANQHWMGSDEISKRVQVKQKISKLQREASNTAINSKVYAEMQDELFVNMREQERLEELIRASSPLYYQGIDSNYITLNDAKAKLLKDHQALIEVFAGDSAVYTLLITSGQDYFYRVEKNQFDSAVLSYTSYISDRRLLNSDFAGFRKVSHQLYQLIFQNRPVPSGRIIISMEGRYFPFESLITEDQGKDPVYFLNDHAVSYAYSARYLMNDFTPALATAKGNFLGIAPLQYRYPPYLSSLVASDGSLKTIGSYFDKCRSQVAQNASRNNFLQTFPGYKIIQLYTHASDTSENKEPVIYFADSTLYLSELIPGSNPITRLIVLSACETGGGTIQQGEGIFSFARGFAAMGIPSCVANLWSVENVPTYHLTELFYKYLSKGYALDMALQKAKLEFFSTASAEDKLPCNWASAILIGKTDAIENDKSSFPWTSILLVTCLGGVIIWRMRHLSHN